MHIIALYADRVEVGLAAPAAHGTFGAVVHQRQLDVVLPGRAGERLDHQTQRHLQF